VVTYDINLPEARTTVLGAEHLSECAEQRLCELTEKLAELTEDVRITADDLIRILTIHANCATQVAEKALMYAREDGDLPKLGE
jgi:hypothetical protein